MGQLLFGLAGAGIGSLFGSPQIGFLVGSLLGSLLDPPKQEGPRLNDLKLQTATYGKVIPVFWGTGRLGGNIIDQTDLKEHKQKSGGKGGPVIINYTYSASFAVQIGAARVFGQPAILGIRRIWADARLIWSFDDGSDIPCTVYDGSQTQLPDPTFEAIHGVGNVPAYRGQAYVVFADYFLTDFGNRIPNLEFEVFTGAGNYPWQVSVDQSYVATNPGNKTFSYDSVNSVLTVASVNVTSFLGTPTSHFHWSQWDVTTTPWTQIGSTVDTDLIGYNPTSAATNSLVYMVDTPSLNYYWAAPDSGGTYAVGSEDPLGDGLPPGSVAFGGYWYGPTALGTDIAKWQEGTSFVTSTSLGATYGGGALRAGVDEDGNVWLTFSGAGAGRLWKFDSDLNLIHAWTPTDLAGTQLADGPDGTFMVYKNQIAFSNHPDVGTWEISLCDISASFVVTDSAHALTQNTYHTSYIVPLTKFLGINETGIFSLEPPPADVLLSTIVGNLSGMTPINGAYDASDLTDLVHWYILGSQMTVRNAIQALRQGFFFDAVESDDIVKFWKRRIVPNVAAIPDDDLVGRGYGEPFGDPLRTQRKREQELPRSITMTYINIETDYQTGAEPARRQVTLSDQDVAIQVPIGFTSNEARQRTETILAVEWIERETFLWSTTRKWAHVEPCDVWFVRGRIIRVQTRTESPNGVIKFTGVLAAPSLYTSLASSVYTQTAVGGGGGGFVPPTPPGPKVGTTLILLDIPLIGDGDFPNGIYGATRPITAGSWSGDEIYESSDGGTTYNSVGSTSAADIIGTVATAVGDFQAGNIFDEQNSITVAISTPDGELSSVSRTAVLNGANLALLGYGSNAWEVIQFRDATLVGTNTYKLTGLLRGRRGTEWMIPLHVSGETFILLPATVNINAPFGELGASRKYKAVTFGGTLAGATAQDFTNTGVALKCYAPVKVGGGRNAAGDIYIHWKRRARYGGEWLNGIDVPLNEAIEGYQITLYSGSDYSTIITVYDPSGVSEFIYTVAEQTVDFGGTVSPLYGDVAQFGSFGWGYRTRFTI